MATRKPKAKKPSKPPLIIHTFTLTAQLEAVLTEIAATASDILGRKVSRSSVLRALLSFTDSQDSRWIARELFPFIEKEIVAGRVWGTRSKSSSD